MKKIVFAFFILFSLLRAEDSYKSKLFTTILSSIFQIQPINIYVDDDVHELLKDNKHFQILNICDDSITLLIGKKFDNLSEICKQKPMFSTSYRSFKHNQNSFGAFYWRKGRPQIKFKKSVLEKYNLTLPNGLKRYAQ